MKNCKKCGGSEFYAGGNCKVCHKAYRDANKEKGAAYNAMYRAANAENIAEQQKQYRQANKEHISAVKSVYIALNREKIAARRAAYYIANKEFINAGIKAWGEANRDRKRSYRRKYEQKNLAIVRAKKAQYRIANKELFRLYQQNRKARLLAGGTLSRDIIPRLLRLQRGRCVCCGLPLGRDYHLDHQFPLALGGKNTDDNMQLLRKLCNLRKSAKHPVEYMQENGFLL